MSKKRIEGQEIPLTPQEAVFVQEVVRGMSYVDAFRKAYEQADKNVNNDTYARATSWRIAKRPHVAQEIATLRAKAADDAMISAAQIFQEWLDIATANPGDIVHHRRVPCRHCHGLGFKWQWRATEFADAVAATTAHNATAAPDKQRPMPELKGGTAYTTELAPHPECPACDGNGEGEIFVADTRYLTGKAAKLYAGVKQTKNGFEVLFRDQDAALLNLARALGMLVEKVKQVDPSTPDATPEDFLRQLADLLPK